MPATLLQCPDCHFDLPEAEERCPKCGFAFDDVLVEPPPGIVSTMLLYVAGLFVSAIFGGVTQTPQLFLLGLVFTAWFAAKRLGKFYRHRGAHDWFASRHGIIHCPHCDYQLTGLSREECPECGKAFSSRELLANNQLPPHHRIRELALVAVGTLLLIVAPILLWFLIFAMAH